MVGIIEKYDIKIKLVIKAAGGTRTHKILDYKSRPIANSGHSDMF